MVAALLAGQSVSAVAREFALNKGTVSRWKNVDAAGLLQPVATQKEGGDAGAGRQHDFEAMVADNLAEHLETTTALLRFVRSTEWLAQQSAAEVATLFGVTSDKTVRLLSALQPADGSGEDGGGVNVGAAGLGP